MIAIKSYQIPEIPLYHVLPKGLAKQCLIVYMMQNLTATDFKIGLFETSYCALMAILLILIIVSIKSI